MYFFKIYVCFFWSCCRYIQLGTVQNYSHKDDNRLCKNKKKQTEPKLDIRKARWLRKKSALKTAFGSVNKRFFM